MIVIHVDVSLCHFGENAVRFCLDTHFNVKTTKILTSLRARFKWVNKRWLFIAYVMGFYIFKARHQHFFLNAITTFLPRSQHNKTLLFEVDHYFTDRFKRWWHFWKLYIAQMWCWILTTTSCDCDTSYRVRFPSFQILVVYNEISARCILEITVITSWSGHWCFHMAGCSFRQRNGQRDS